MKIGLIEPFESYHRTASPSSSSFCMGNINRSKPAIPHLSDD